MSQTDDLILRNVGLNGKHTDVRIAQGQIAEIGPVAANSTQEVDGRGGALIAGLHDHHIHLFATAARLASVDLSGASSLDDLLSRLRTAAADQPPDQWLRAVGYDDTDIGLISASDLDSLNVPNPIRVQDRTGALWVLNKAAMDRVLEDPLPACAEQDGKGRATGRIWRGDAWLRTRIGGSAPSLQPLSQRLAAFGVTGVTDASVTNGPEEARLLAEARSKGELLQSLCVMSGRYIPEAENYDIGPFKILPDDRDLPLPDDIAEKIKEARNLGRHVAVHCVTAAELAVTLAAFTDEGSTNGDRIEHGGIIPPESFETLRSLNLTVVTQPNFVLDRGDRYLHSVDAKELPDLYRLASLDDARIKLAAGSDAPYGGFDPWSAIKAATNRQTRDGQLLGRAESISATRALTLYLGSAPFPSGPTREVVVGQPADLCLLKEPMDVVLGDPFNDKVAATIIKGQVVFLAD